MQDSVFVLVFEFVGFEVEVLFVDVESEEVGKIYVKNIEEVKIKSVFGLLIYFFGDEMFYGQDWFEMIEWWIE